MTASQQTHWNHVARHWKHWAPPLRPCSSDIRLMEDLLHTWSVPKSHRSRRALLWGVTPEIAEMNWPEDMQLVALDRSREMIEEVWPGDVVGRRKAIQGNWLDSPLGNGGFDVVIGDGVFTLLRFPDDYRSMAEQAHRLLDDGGVLITRLFVRPPEAESTEAILGDLNNGRMGSFHLFKFRLAMSLQTDAASGVRMRDVFDAWAATGIAPDNLAASTGWSRDAINTIEQYRDREDRLSFPTLDEFRAVMHDFLEPIDCCFPDYEMGNRFPILCYRVRSTASGH